MSLDRARAEAMVERLRTLVQPQRLMILNALLDAELAVGGIEAATGIGQPALSQQLAELRRAELVMTRREARQIYYRVADEDVEERIRALFAAFGAARPTPTPTPMRTGRTRSAVADHLTGAASFARVEESRSA